MDAKRISEFEAKLAAEGYEVGTKSMEPSSEMADHSHHFHVLGLVTAGDFHITVEGESRHFEVGDQFTMAADRVHSETVGPDGVSFVVGRRDP